MTMAELELNFLYAMQGAQKELSRITNSPFVAGLPFLYDFLRDERWLQLAQKELFADSLRQNLFWTLVKASWPTVTPDEEKFYGYKPLRPGENPTNLKLRPNEPVTLLFVLELVLLATGSPYSISGTPRKKTPMPEDQVPQRITEILGQFTLESVFDRALCAIANTEKLKQPRHLLCMVQNFALTVFGLHWYTTARKEPLEPSVQDANEWLKSLRLSFPYKFELSEPKHGKSGLLTPLRLCMINPFLLLLPRCLASYPFSSGSWNLMQFCIGSKSKAMVMANGAFYKGLYNSLESRDVLSFREWIPKLVIGDELKQETKEFFEFPWDKGNKFTWALGSNIPTSPHHGQHHESLVFSEAHLQSYVTQQPGTRIKFIQPLVHLAHSGSEPQTYAKDHSQSLETTFKFVNYMQPPTPTKRIGKSSQLSNGGSAKRQGSSGYEKHPNKRQAVEALVEARQHDVVSETFAPSMTIAPADTFISSPLAVQPTASLPFPCILSIPWVFDPRLPSVLDTTDGNEPGSASPSRNTGSWNDDPAWKALCNNDDHIWELNPVDEAEVWAQYIKLPELDN